MLYELALALPAGEERNRLNQMVSERLAVADAATFTGIATALAHSSRTGFTSARMRSRVSLVLSLPMGTGGQVDTLALALIMQPDFARDIVRIDFPQEQPALVSALKKDCRVEVPGIYFDFDRDTLKPQSERALREMAAALQAMPRQAFRVEGHTDNIGGDRHNDDLSARRAAAVKAALVRDFGVDGSRLSTAGFGARRPVETNATLVGRARNRRVELVCAGKPAA